MLKFFTSLHLVFALTHLGFSASFLTPEDTLEITWPASTSPNPSKYVPKNEIYLIYHLNI
jgi:hypothetical protein